MALEEKSYTVDEAFAAMKAMRSDEEVSDEESEVVDEPEEEPEENESEDTFEDDHPDPTIEPPVSWSSDEKEQFRNLPPEAQKVIAARESERDRYLKQKTDEISQKQKEAEKLLEEARQNREKYLAELQQVVEKAPESPDPDLNDPDSDKYDPDKYARLNAKYLRDRKAFDERQAELDKVKAEREAEHKEAITKWHGEKISYLTKEWPEILDPEKSPSIQNEILEYAKARGINPESLPYASGPELAVLKDALFGHSVRSKAPGTSDRMKKAPPVTRPGSPKSKKFSDTEKLRKMKAKALKSGKLEDMRAYMKASRNG